MMNNSYLASSSNDYFYEYFSPPISTYYYSPSVTSCPVHSSYPFYSSPTQSMHTSPASCSYLPQEQSQLFSPSIQQHTNAATSVDRTPLRRYQCFKKTELQILHQIYIQDTYPTIDVLQQLAVQLKVSVDKVRQWFKNRRHSDKRKKQTTARPSTTP